MRQAHIVWTAAMVAVLGATCELRSWSGFLLAEAASFGCYGASYLAAMAVIKEKRTGNPVIGRMVIKSVAAVVACVLLFVFGMKEAKWEFAPALCTLLASAAYGIALANLMNLTWAREQVRAAIEDLRQEMQEDIHNLWISLQR